MSLTLQKLELNNFRNYSHFLLDEISPLTIFIGPNAVGKTNLMEAIDLVTGINSFRNAKNEELVVSPDIPGVVKAQVSDKSRNLDIKLVIKEGKKHYFLNEKEKRTTQIKGLIPAITFIPDDLLLIKSSNTHRRRSLDQLGSQLAPTYPAIKRDYEQILRQKNNVLKDEVDIAFLESINDVFITCATQFFCYRLSLFNKLLPYIQEYYKDIAQRNEEITATYTPSWMVGASPYIELDAYNKDDIYQRIKSAVEENIYKEIAAKHTLIGPHKDEITFFINHKQAGIYGSQGQQRSLVLAWKLAEVALVEDMLQTKPILLLDDVMSELDETRRDMLTKYVRASTQTFITTTHASYFSSDILDTAQIVSLDYREV